MTKVEQSGDGIWRGQRLGQTLERDPGGCENQRGRGGAPPHTPLPGRLSKKAQSLRGRLFIGLRARPVATASACTSQASGGAPGLLAGARAPERLRRPLAPGCAETGEYPSPPRPGLGRGGCGKRSAGAERQAPRTARPHCVLTSNPPPPRRVISPSLGVSPPFPGSRGTSHLPEHTSEGQGNTRGRAGAPGHKQQQQQKQQPPLSGAPGHLEGLHHLWTQGTGS